MVPGKAPIPPTPSSQSITGRTANVLGERSEKYALSENLIYYYDPRPIRNWPSRDPIEEQGGVNLYGFVGNNGVSEIDLYGLVTFQYLGKGFTKAEKDFLNKRTQEIENRLPDIKQTIADWKARAEQLCDVCEYKEELVQQMTDLKKMIDALSTGIKASTIRVRLVDMGDEVYGREIAVKNIFGMVLRRRIELNSHPGPMNFFSEVEQARMTLFHEITHQYGTIDDGDAYNNAHQLERLVTDGIWGFARTMRNELIVRHGKKNCPYYVGEDASFLDQWPDNE